MSIVTSKQSPVDRLNYNGDLQSVVSRLCEAFHIGVPINFSVINVGYEDCNIIITTANGKFVAKMFSKTRTKEDIVRYCMIMDHVVHSGVNHPELLKFDNKIVFEDKHANNISIVLMQFVGKSYYDLGRVPTSEELIEILKQASIVNKITYHPKYIFDSWAIPNIHKMFEKVKPFVQTEDLKLINKVIEEYNKIPISKLEHTFVHGDLTKGNVLIDEKGKIYFIDFSVANWYPRIQELSVVIANLIYYENDKTSLQEKCDFVADIYSKFATLSLLERTYLYSYTLSGIAMEFMGAHQEKYINGSNTEETDYWLKLGRDSLVKALS